MLIITHHIKSASDFMDRYLPQGAAGGLFLPEKLGMPQGGASASSSSSTGWARSSSPSPTSSAPASSGTTGAAA
ncbi:MAG: hypothetical protein R3F43_03945 [bacterium]